MESVRTGRRLASGELWVCLLAPFGAILVSLLIGGWLSALFGANPLDAYGAIFEGSFGSLYGFGTAILKAIPLLFAGLAVALAFRCGLFNIGAEGQLHFGALGAVLAGVYLNLPPIVHIPVSLFAAFVGGALWGAVPGYLRAKRGVSEIMTTVLMNFIAMYLISYLVSGPLKDPKGIYPQTSVIAESARLPFLYPAARVHAGIFVGVLAVIIAYVILRHTTTGFEMRAVGANPQIAHQAGINVQRNVVLAMILSGGLAGLAGAVEILGSQFRLLEYFSTGWGYTGIAVAVIGGLNPFGILAASLFFGILETGANTMQRSVGVPGTLVLLIEGLAVLLVLASSVVSSPRIRSELAARMIRKTEYSEGGAHVVDRLR